MIASEAAIVPSILFEGDGCALRQSSLSNENERTDDARKNRP